MTRPKPQRKFEGAQTFVRINTTVAEWRRRPRRTSKENHGAHASQASDYDTHVDETFVHESVSISKGTEKVSGPS